MLKPILSGGEFEAEKRIRSASQKHDARCFTMIRIADVFGEVKGQGLRSDLVGYALKAHFDFMIADQESRPLFAVEYDGAHHLQETQRARDRLKDDICRHFGLPFVRITSRHLFGSKDDLLSWLLDYWFYSQMLSDAQAEGRFPEDELPDPLWIAHDGESQGVFPMMLSLRKRAAIKRLFDKRRVLEPTPFEWIGERDDADGEYSAVSVLKVRAGGWAVASTRFTAFDFGFLPSDVVSELNLLDLYRLLQVHFADPAAPLASAQATAVLVEEGMSGCHMCQAGGGGGNLDGVVMSPEVRRRLSKLL